MGPTTDAGEPESARSRLRDGIDFFGDVDEYSVTLAQGQQFRLALTLSAPWGATQGTAELLDPTGTTVLTTVQAVPPTGTHLSPQVTIPAAGTYRIRIQSVTDVDGQGPYVMTFEP